MSLRMRGARQNNLEDLDLDFAYEAIHAIVGPSGSGKSSLALDTLYAEGQRRYVATFGAFSRQFIAQLDRPEVDRIEGIPPAIAIEGQSTIRSARSTVATLTEVADLLKLLFARAGSLTCPGCDAAVEATPPEVVVEALEADLHPGRRLLVIARRPWRQDEGTPAERRGVLAREGYRRLVAGGSDPARDLAEEQTVLLEEAPDELFAAAHIALVVDRIRWRPDRRDRLVEAVEQAYALAEGRVEVVAAGPDGGWHRAFSRDLHCPTCDRSFRRPHPHLFSFSSPLGACPTCRGFGRVEGLDPRRLVPDEARGVGRGALAPLARRRFRGAARRLQRYLAEVGIDPATPWRDLDPDWRQRLLAGDPERGWPGIGATLDRLSSKRYRADVRATLARYRGYFRCPDCQGSRLQPEAHWWRVAGRTIAEVMGLRLAAALDYARGLDDLVLRRAERDVVDLIRGELRARLTYLVEAGLGYLPLDRPSRTLSAGEVQRVNLTSALGSALADTLFVLDEPTVGLHARDMGRIIGALERLKRQRNTVIVVDHAPPVIAHADRVVELGPGAGRAGGRVVFDGTPAGLAAAGTPTGRALAGTLGRPRARQRRRPRRWLTLRRVTLHNLDRLDADIPLDAFVVLSGVSGSGKSTLMQDVLYPLVARHKGRAVRSRLDTDDLLELQAQVGGVEQVEDVLLVDQSPVSSSPRATPVTFSGAFDALRQRFASTELALGRGYTRAHFSFNVPGGRCETCEGAGSVRIDMQYMADVFVRCDECEGRRYRPEILDVHLEGLSIADVLDLTLEEALERFASIHSITHRLRPLVDVGLGYLRLGQPLSTLSGGEAQRLKLGRQLALAYKERRRGADAAGGGMLLLLDEPTTGLHPIDVERLIEALDRLVDMGHSVLVIEHDLSLIAAADWIIDMGPDAGPSGGRIVAAGPPEQVSTGPGHTARHLAAFLRGDPLVDEAGARDAPPAPPLPPRAILIKGAREHNLQSVDVQIPRGRFVVITGVSGSGKSSLAFDVIVSEGRRRYMDVLAPYARQFFGQSSRADVDRLIGLPPTVAIEQRRARSGGRRSTVATVSELAAPLRLLLTRLGRQSCIHCGGRVEKRSLDEVARALEEMIETSPAPIGLFAPVVRARKGVYRDYFRQLARRGVPLVRVDGRLYPPDRAPELSRFREHDVEVCLVEEAQAPLDPHTVARLVDLGRGDILALPMAQRDGAVPRLFSIHRTCETCHRSYPELDPRQFSPTTRQGRCPRCGTGEAPRPTCRLCRGTGFRPESLAVTFRGHNMADFLAMTLGELQEFEASIEARSALEEAVLAPIRRDLAHRLRFLLEVGVDYLELGRPMNSLSGGEAQRIRLAAQLASGLTGACYVLDEPTIGLHPRDNDRLVRVLQQLAQGGATVLVVEHDEATIRAADWIIDLGPGAGAEGGRVVATGRLDDLLRHPASVTGRCLRRPTWPWRHRPRRTGSRSPLHLRGARVHNLHNLDVTLPTGCLVAVSGVSGSGKSSLLYDALLPALEARLAGKAPPKTLCRGLDPGHIERVVDVDQRPIGRTPRSVPASYSKILTPIRALFAALPESNIRGYDAGRFSFNRPEGQCPLCKGLGEERISMSFLPDVRVRCEACEGRRYNDETLVPRFKGHSIADVLDLTVQEARDLFSAHRTIFRPLDLLCSTGLGYLRLGQPSFTLSGGEAQRLKLVSELASRRVPHTLYLLDEPTTGLHMADVERLIDIFDRLVDQGGTVVVVEHNLEVLSAADWIIDLGPEGGKEGGRIVVEGPPETVVRCAASHTGRALAPLLQR